MRPRPREPSVGRTEAKHDDGAIEMEYEVDSNRADHDLWARHLVNAAPTVPSVT